MRNLDVRPTYEETKKEAQKKADNFGLYFRIRNDYSGAYYAHLAPKPKNQYGADRDGELVQPSTYREGDWE